ncbi:MAG: hypothetical protein ACPLVJ_01910 [Candidatus Bathyarchaeales archaeon]
MLNRRGLSFLLLALLCFSYFFSSCFAVDRGEAEEVLAKAENDLASAYVSVADAQQAGANVSELLSKLVFAGDLLAEANNSYRIGDYEKTYLLAINCSNAVNDIALEASDLKLKAEKAYSERILFTAGISSAGLSVLFVLSLFVWKFLRKKYVEQVLKMKPEVEDAT